MHPAPTQGSTTVPSSDGDTLMEELEDLLRQGCTSLDESAVVGLHDTLRAAQLRESARARESSLLHSMEAVLLAEVVDRGAVFGGEQNPEATGGGRRHAPAACWRRLVCPAHFSLLQLHVLLQAAFDLPDTSSHSFRQYGAQGTGEGLAAGTQADRRIGHCNTEATEGKEGRRGGGGGGAVISMRTVRDPGCRF